MVDYVNRWTERAELPARRLLAWLDLASSKFHQWKGRYGKANEHNGLVPRDWWLEDWEKRAILDYFDSHPLNGYRRLAFMMLDDDVVAVSPASVYRVLKQAGVGHVFTLCGGHILPIYDGCLDEGIVVIDVRHEQAAAHAADAYARLTRGIGVAMVAPGPGVTDAVTGIANAYAARSPVLLIGGAAPLGLRGLGALQEMEQVALLRPITKGVVTPGADELQRNRRARSAKLRVAEKLAASASPSAASATSG